MQGNQGWQGLGTQGSQGGVGAVLIRYQADATAGEEVEVLATAAGITYSSTGNVGTFSIPSGVHLSSVRLRVPGAAVTAGQFTFDMGTVDMSNSSLANRWGPLTAVFVESTGSTQPTSTTLDLSNHSKFTINNMSGSVTNHVRLSF